jgi:hypothetical protein
MRVTLCQGQRSLLACQHDKPFERAEDKHNRTSAGLAWTLLTKGSLKVAGCLLVSLLVGVRSPSSHPSVHITPVKL